MTTFKLLIASTISFAGLFGISAVSHAGYSCSNILDTTYCSGSINGVSVNSSSSTILGTTYTNGSVGGEYFSQSCSTILGTTYCNW